MKFGEDDWRFDSPGAAPPRLISAVSSIVGRVAGQGDALDIYEHYKRHFAKAAGQPYGPSSSTNWAETDLYRYMEEAAANAALFIEAFVEGSESLASKGIAVPKPARINRLLEESHTSFCIAADGRLVSSPDVTVALKGVGAITGIGHVSASSATPLRVFLCHANEDKARVRELYAQLRTYNYLPWLDEEDLLPGQLWKDEIPKAVRASHIVLVCLSNKSVNKEGYVQEEILFASEVARRKPQGTLFIIPARLEPCDIPAQFADLQWVDLHAENGFAKLQKSLLAKIDELKQKSAL